VGGAVRKVKTGVPVALLASVLLTSGCGEAVREAEPASPQGLDTEALKQALNGGDCVAARRELERVEPREVETSVDLGDARLETAFVCLGAGDNAAALAETGQYLERHPAHRHRDYGLYLRGMALFAEWRAARETGAGIAERSDKARAAMTGFRALVARYPDSRYAEQLPPLVRTLREGLAADELELAQRAFSTGDAVAAAARARYIATGYPDTEAALAALALAARAYEQVGRHEEAASALHQLKTMLNGRAAARPGNP